MTTTLTARGPEDLLAAVPVVLGFHPEDSLVMLTFGAERSFHARLDLPATADERDVADVVDALLAPSQKHEVDHVVFVVYSADAALAARLAAALVPAFVADGIGVVDVLRAHEGGWCSVPIRAGAEEPPLTPYDDTHHPFSAQAVFEGRVTHATRDDLRATVTADTVLVRRREARLEELGEPGPAEVVRARDLVAGWVAAGEAPDEAGACRVLRAVTRVEVRDAALYAVTRDTVHDHLRVWTALLRGAPDAQEPTWQP
jgi:ADP-ribose pyrophosphatase YjhB (NUDIX family)